MGEVALKNEKCVWDIAKLIMAFLVVGIHTGYGTNNINFEFFSVQWFGRFAVPLFFCLSAYFLFCKIDNSKCLSPKDDKLVKEYFFRIFGMYLFWSAFYLLFNIYEWICSGITLKDILVYIEYATIRGDSYTHLWFLSSLFTAAGLVWLLNKFISLKGIFIISFILYLFGLLWLPHYYLIEKCVESNSILSSLFEFLNRYIGWPRNGVFFGFVFFTMGALIAKNRKNQNRNLKLNVICAIFFVALSFAEICLIRAKSTNPDTAYGALQLSLIPATFFLFNSINGLTIPSKNVYKTLRKCSSLIYCIHPAVIFIISSIAQKSIFVNNFIKIPFAFVILTYCLSFLSSLIIIRISNCKPMSFLKKMY